MSFIKIDFTSLEVKNKLIEKLEVYYNSDSFRIVSVGDYTIPNRAWIRSLADEGIVAYNDKINSGQIQRDEELPIKWKIGGIKIPLTYSFLCTVSEDLTRMINILYIKKEDTIDELNKSTSEDYISSWLENSKQELDDLKASL